MDFLRRFDKEILIGQISYKQRADTYNEVHGYGAEYHARSDNACSSSLAYTEIVILYKLLACLIKPQIQVWSWLHCTCICCGNFLPSSTHYLIHTSRHNFKYKVVQT